VARRGLHLREAVKAAKRLGREYAVISVSGTIKLNGKETWDEAILIIKNAGAKGEAPEAILHTAAQTKVERRISAVDQSIRDRLREGGLETYQPSLLEIEGENAVAFVLRPNPEAVTVSRYLLHAEGGKVSKTAIQRLIAAGMSLEKLELDITIEQLNRIADHLIDSTVKVDLAGSVRP
jgi:hypothetical protein